MPHTTYGASENISKSETKKMKKMEKRNIVSAL